MPADLFTKNNMITKLLHAVMVAYPEVYYLDYEVDHNEEYCVVYVKREPRGGTGAPEYKNYKICITADSLQSMLIDITKGLAKHLG